MNSLLHSLIKTLTEQTEIITGENKIMKETFLDLQSQSMRYNLKGKNKKELNLILKKNKITNTKIWVESFILHRQF